MAGIYKGLRNWLGVKRSSSGLPPIGQRELAVVEILWARGPLSAQQVLALLPAAGIGLSTVQSTLERLSRKAILRREKAGRAYVYGALLSRSEMIGSLLRDIAQELAGGDREAMISGFMDYLGDEATGRRDPQAAGRPQGAQHPAVRAGRARAWGRGAPRRLGAACWGGHDPARNARAGRPPAAGVAGRPARPG